MDKLTTMAILHEWPSGLETAAAAAEKIGISEARLKGLADGGFAPHYRIDGGNVLFKVSELKRWAAVNILQRVEGVDLPSPIRVVSPFPAVHDRTKIPESLAEIPGLKEVTADNLRSGIYFLCADCELLYVGQSVNVVARVSSGHSDKPYREVYFLPWPADDLNRIEGALIRALRPPLNGKTPKGSMLAPGAPYQDVKILTQIGMRL